MKEESTPITTPAEVRDKLINQIKGLSDDLLPMLQAALDCIHEKNHGGATPVEEYVYTLLLMYRIHGRITPEQAAEELETFTGNYNSILSSCKHIVATHPELINQKQSKPEEAQPEVSEDNPQRAHSRGEWLRKGAESDANWETFTPPEPPNPREGAIIQYDLEMYVDAGAGQKGQQVNITRDEFVSLKRYLAQMRRRHKDDDDSIRYERLREILTGAWSLAALDDGRFSEADRFPAIRYLLGVAMELAK